MPILPVLCVSADIIRQKFNENHLYEKTLTGEIHKIVKRNSHCEPPPKGEPFCTHSQIVYYYDKSNNPLAIVHQYLRPDGKLGASGLPDPKKLIMEDKILMVKREK